MTDKDVVERAAGVMGSRVLGPRQYYGRKGEAFKPLWVTNVQGWRAPAWMMMLWPFMGARRKQRILELLALWRQEPPSVYLGGSCKNRQHHAAARRGRGRCQDCARTQRRTRYLRDRYGRDRVSQPLLDAK